MTDGTLPYLRIADFLRHEAHAEILGWALAHIDAFGPSQINEGKSGGLIRRSISIRPDKRVRRILRDAIEAQLPQVLAALRMPAFDHVFEQEVVCYHDGAYFRRHIDTRIGANGFGTHRRVSAVYYFHREPKAFSGGQLRLHPLLPHGAPVDIEPEQNLLVAFPSFTPHEVLPVTCASSNAADARFAVNIWLHNAARAPQSDAASSRSVEGPVAWPAGRSA